MESTQKQVEIASKIIANQYAKMVAFQAKQAERAKARNSKTSK